MWVKWNISNKTPQNVSVRRKVNFHLSCFWSLMFIVTACCGHRDLRMSVCQLRVWCHRPLVSQDLRSGRWPCVGSLV